jgi:uncharacterized protein YndB with AHSA1/START domain
MIWDKKAVATKSYLCLLLMNPIERTILIHALPEVIWNTLTDRALMKQWMGDPEMRIDIQTDWKVGSPVIISGVHHGKFVNRGVVLENELYRKLVYTHLSSVSRLPDVPESYVVQSFILEPEGDQTRLTVRISNFPTESIYKHMEFYWGTTLLIIKKLLEN